MTTAFGRTEMTVLGQHRFGASGTLAAALVASRLTGKQISEIDESWQLANDAEGVQTMFTVADILGWDQLGWKIAATNPLLQSKLRTEGPVFGVTYSRFMRPAPAEVSYELLQDPVVECEFAFRIGRCLPILDREYTFDDLASVVDSVTPCIEIAECRFTRGVLPPARFIMADGFASGWYILGAQIPNWRAVLDRGVSVQLMRNGAHHSRGHSSDVMTHPLNPVVWLANSLKRLGKQLQPGHLVSSGACNILCRAKPGDRFEAQYEGCGVVILETP